MGDRPEDAAEEHHLHDRADDDEQEVERTLGEGSNVLGNALIGVVDFCVGVELVEMPVAEVAAQEAPVSQRRHWIPRVSRTK